MFYCKIILYHGTQGLFLLYINVIPPYTKYLGVLQVTKPFMGAPLYTRDFINFSLLNPCWFLFVFLVARYRNPLLFSFLKSLIYVFCWEAIVSQVAPDLVRVDN